MRAPDPGVEGRNEELTARRVERAARNDERAFDSGACEKPLFETRGETVQECRIDGIDWDDPYRRVHLVASASLRTRAKLAAAAKAKER
jgi:hypothetical protein